MLHQLAASVPYAQLATWAQASLAALSMALGVGAYLRWRGNEIAMRHGRSLQRSWLVPMLAGAAVLMGCTALVTMHLQP